jgi:hypothetical protein
LAEAALTKKGKEMEWLGEGRNAFILHCIKPAKPEV